MSIYLVLGVLAGVLAVVIITTWIVPDIDYKTEYELGERRGLSRTAIHHILMGDCTEEEAVKRYPRDARGQG